jgi:hypothetical protein
MQYILDIVLIALLAATLFHAVRLERALGLLKRDRAALAELVAGFNDSTRAAENGIDNLRRAADGAGRQVQRQVELAGTVKEDLSFLIERGERLADRLDGLVRAARPLAQEPPRLALNRLAEALPEVEAERPLAVPDEAGPRLRSQAERDLMKALRMVR